jgi:hypothetical protein
MNAPLVEVHRLEKAWTGLRQIPGKAKAAFRSISTSLIPVDTRYQSIGCGLARWQKVQTHQVLKMDEISCFNHLGGAFRI